MFITSLRHWGKFLKYWDKAESQIWTKKQNKSRATASLALSTNPPHPPAMAATLTATTAPHTLTLNKKAGGILHGASPQGKPKPQPFPCLTKPLTPRQSSRDRRTEPPSATLRLLPRPSGSARPGASAGRVQRRNGRLPSDVFCILYICIFLNVPEQINSSPSYQDGDTFVFWRLGTVMFSFQSPLQEKIILTGLKYR